MSKTFHDSKTPDYRCPACKSMLHLEELEGERWKFMYCAYGPCPSERMNEGVEGVVLSEMYGELTDIWEEEQSASIHRESGETSGQ